MSKVVHLYVCLPSERTGYNRETFKTGELLAEADFKLPHISHNHLSVLLRRIHEEVSPFIESVRLHLLTPEEGQRITTTMATRHLRLRPDSIELSLVHGVQHVEFCL